MFQSSPFLRSRVRDDAIHLPSFVAFREIFRDRQAIFPDKQQAVAVLVDLHFIASAHPATEFGFGVLILVEVARAEGLAQLVHVHGEAFDYGFSDGGSGMHGRSTLFRKSLYILPHFVEILLTGLSHWFSVSVRRQRDYEHHVPTARSCHPIVYKRPSVLYNPTLRANFLGLVENGHVGYL